MREFAEHIDYDKEKKSCGELPSLHGQDSIALNWSTGMIRP